MADIQELRETVNPVFNTARSCVQLDAASGDEDAQRLLDAMGFESFGAHTQSKNIPAEIVEQVKRLAPVYMTLTDSRFEVVNGIIASRPEREVVDLPCGYTSRGVRMHRQTRTYFGLDLPAVIDVIEPAAREVMGGKDPAVRYRAVDATNYESLEKAVSEATGELLVVTEGLLMYFSQQELEVVFSNIHRLLARHGGSWVIVDRAYSLGDHDIASAVLGGDPRLVGLYDAITDQAAGTTADIVIRNNVMFDEDEGKAVSFVHQMGFDLARICAHDFLPDELGALRAVPERKEDVTEVFRQVFLWELTVSGRAVTRERRGKTFAAHAEVRDQCLRIEVAGRLDTLTAPELLDLFRGQDASSYTDIELDFQDLDYISSAGIRVLVIMFKALGGRGDFSAVGANATVSEAIEMTGLADLLLA